MNPSRPLSTTLRTCLQARPLANMARTPAVARPMMMSFARGPARRAYSTEQQAQSAAKGRGAVGPFTIRAGALFALTGAGLYIYFQNEKRARLARKEAETATAKIGRPKIGGDFVLTDQDGQPWDSREKMKGRWSLVYFGFTNCPDICPEELDKMGVVVNAISESLKIDILPVFITCDPARDDVKAVKAYVRDFHPSLVGLTGTYEEIKKCCKAYRVYFSTPPNAKPTDDYLVDHSIFFYLIDPSGAFRDAFGRSMSADEVIKKISEAARDFPVA